MKEELVSFEIAKLLKRLGFISFSEEELKSRMCIVHYIYDEDGKLAYDEDGFYVNTWVYDGISIFPIKGKYRLLDTVEAPTQSLVQKWLREIHNIHLLNGFNYDKHQFKVVRNIAFTSPIMTAEYDTYEEALEEALQQGLKLLS